MDNISGESCKSKAEHQVIIYDSDASMDFSILPIPSYLRHYPGKSLEPGIWTTLALGLAASCLASNLYYCQPLLLQMADTFQVSGKEVSNIPTLIQAGNAAGMLFVCPLGDLVRRRPLLLIFILSTTLLTIGLAITNSLATFQTLNFLVGFLNGSTEIIVAIAADIAPHGRRGRVFSIVIAGILLGTVIARVMAGVVAQYVAWRVVYYMAVAAQFCALISIYFIVPDLPPKNKNKTYFEVVGEMLKYSVTEPLVVQTEIIAMMASACMTSFIVPLTFLLGGAIYNYSTLVIGLFGLIPLAGMIMAPIAGRIIDDIYPWYGILLSTFGLLLFQIIPTAAAGLSVVAVIVAYIGLEIVYLVEVVSLVSLIISLEQAALTRLYALNGLSFFIGQIIGSSVGSKLFLTFGWRACGAFALAGYGFQIAILFLRGPHCRRRTWFGYEGGWKIRKGPAGET